MLWLSRLGLGLNLVAALLLGWALTVPAADIRFVTARDTNFTGDAAPGVMAYGICVNGQMEDVADTNGSEASGRSNCLHTEKTRSSLMLIANPPWALQTGLGLLALGFLAQFVALPKRR